MGTTTLAVALAVALLGGRSPARAGEADDLQAMIERARNGASDLERLDERNAARDEVTLMRVWLDEAWRLRSEGKYDEVREVLTRTDAQAEMIRQKIVAAGLAADAAAREAELQKLRAAIEKTRRAIATATVEKAGLEAKTGQ
jgi:soluble cytochrome b562